MDTGTSLLVYFTFALVGFLAYKIGHEAGVEKEQERQRIQERREAEEAL